MKTTCLTPKAIAGVLEEAGVRPTVQRVAICQFVLCNADHPTAEEVKARVNRKFKQVSMATVYNTLNTLVRVGLLKEVRLPHTDKTIYDPNTEPHYHLVDVAAGKIVELSPEQIKVDIDKTLEVDVESIEVVIQGHLKAAK